MPLILILPFFLGLVIADTLVTAGTPAPTLSSWDAKNCMDTHHTVFHNSRVGGGLQSTVRNTIFTAILRLDQQMLSGHQTPEFEE